MRNIWPQGAKDDYHFDTGLTHELIAAYARDKQIGKIFLEPHLKTRLSLAYGKISGVQCEAVRHDDHFHIQLY
jgi:murein endopeptidase